MDPPLDTPNPASGHHRYGERVLAHLEAPQDVGRLTDPTGVGTSGSVACGDLVRIDVRMDGRRIDAARFQAYGCPATIAGASELVGRIVGADVLEAAAISEAAIADDTPALA